MPRLTNTQLRDLLAAKTAEVTALRSLLAAIATLSNLPLPIDGQWAEFRHEASTRLHTIHGRTVNLDTVDRPEVITWTGEILLEYARELPYQAHPDAAPKLASDKPLPAAGMAPLFPIDEAIAALDEAAAEIGKIGATLDDMELDDMEAAAAAHRSDPTAGSGLIVGGLYTVAENPATSPTRVLEAADVDTLIAIAELPGLQIDEGRMWLTVGPGHEAVKVEAGAWRVSWVPGELLTRDEAITALSIAEVVATQDMTDTESKWWAVVDEWAAELGIMGPQAVARASDGPEAAAAEGPLVRLCSRVLDHEIGELQRAGGRAWCNRPAHHKTRRAA